MKKNLTTYNRGDLPQLLQESARLATKSPSTASTTQTMLGDGQKQAQVSEPAFFDQINLDEALQIYTVVRNLEPENSMEIGFCCGGSGLAILKALEDAGKGQHHAVDPFQTSYAGGQGRYNVQHAGLDHRLTFFECFPEKAISDIPRVQFAFIDASHLFDLSMLDFVLADKNLDAGGVLALHDMWMPSLQKLARYILTNRHYEILRVEKPQRERNPRRRLKSLLRKTANSNAVLRRVLAPETLKEWGDFDIPNLLFLKKLKDDDRDWRYHKPF